MTPDSPADVAGAAIRSDAPADEPNVNRAMRWTFSLLVGLLVVSLGAGIWLSRTLNARAQSTYVETVIPLRSELRNLELGMVNQETAVRAYVITGDQVDLQPYRAGRESVESALLAARRLSRDNGELLSLLDAAEVQARDIERFFTAQIALAASNAGRREAQRNIRDGSERFDRFRVIAAALERERSTITAAAVADQNRLTDRLTAILAGFGGLALVVATGLWALVPRHIGRLLGRLRGERDRAADAWKLASDRETRFRFLAELSATLEATDGYAQRLQRGVDRTASLTGLAVIAYPTDPDAVDVIVASPPSAVDLGHRVAELIHDVVENGGSAHRPALPDRSALLAVPFDLSGRQAALVVASPGSDDRDDVAFTRSIATRIGLASDNARLLDEQRALAWTLQQGLLPATLPNVTSLDIAARYRPAATHSAVGGDFYDVFLTDSSIYAVVGDVCGKGPGAAQLTGLVRHTLRAAAIADPDAAPADLIRLLNRAVLDQTAATDYCTVVCARIERQLPLDHPCRVASGGHPAALHRGVDGTVREITAAGPLVGVFDDAEFDETSFTLAEGESILFYTDGAIEARRHDELFGGRRLRRTLVAPGDADAMVRRAETAVIAFTDDGALRDDLVLLALRRTRSEVGDGDVQSRAALESVIGPRPHD